MFKVIINHQIPFRIMVHKPPSNLEGEKLALVCIKWSEFELCASWEGVPEALLSRSVGDLPFKLMEPWEWQVSPALVWTTADKKIQFPLPSLRQDFCLFYSLVSTCLLECLAYFRWSENICFEWTNSCLSFSNHCKVFIVSVYSFFKILFWWGSIKLFPLIRFKTQIRILVLWEVSSQEKERFIQFEPKYGPCVLHIDTHLYASRMF